MNHTVEAIYEQGVLRPLTPVALAESQRVKLVISDPSGGSQRDVAVVDGEGAGSRQTDRGSDD